MHDQDERMNEIMDRLTQLGHAKSSPTVQAPSLETAAEHSRFLRGRLDHMESTLRSIDLTVELLTGRIGRIGPVGRINAEYSDLTCDILSLEYKDRDLLSLSSALAKTLFDLSVQIKRLLSDQAAPPLIKGTKSGNKLHKINVPPFNSEVLNWNSF